MKQCPDIPDVSFKLVGNLCLTDTSSKIAKEVCSRDDPKNCAYGLIEKLGGMNESARCGAQATNALILRQEIAEMVLTASLQVDGFLAEIDSETGEIRAVHDQLTDRRDSAVKRSSFWSAFASGGSAVGSTLALVGNTAATAGNYVGAASGAAGAVFGFLGYFQQRGPMGCFPDTRRDPTAKDTCNKLNDRKHPLQFPVKDPDKKDDCAAIGCSPTMLYQLIFPKPKYIGFHSEYDPSIKNYLLDEPGRRETLIQPWRDEAKELLEKDKGKKEKLEEEARADPNAVLKGEEPYLFTTNADPRKLSIDNLTARANKLADLRSVVSRMNRDLSRLTEDLATGLRCVVP